MSVESFFNSTFDLYRYTPTQDSSGGFARNGSNGTNYPSTPTYASVACSWQPDVSEIQTENKQYQEQQVGFVYFTDSTVFNSLRSMDIFKINGSNYRFRGKQDAAALGTVYRVQLRQDTSGQTIGS